MSGTRSQAVTPSRDRTLDEVKTEVEQRWRDDEIAKRLKDKAADLLDKAKNGNAFDALATAARRQGREGRRSQARRDDRPASPRG